MRAEISQEFRNGVPFLGGSLWIDFVNTRFVLNGESVDFLRDEASLAGWAKEAGIVFDERNMKDERPVLLRLRDGLAVAFEQLSHNAPLSADALVMVNALLGKLTIHMQLSRVADSIILEEQASAAGSDVAVAIAADFARFVANYEVPRLKHCDNPACAIVFYDRGKNMRRRWCSTSICGNRDKVANYRARKSMAGPKGDRL
ncbi:MAG: CGNR zinc finger domain-containing protein [Chakrabartia sp.]